MGEFVTVEFVSSKPRMLEVRREKVSFEANENKMVELYVPP